MDNIRWWRTVGRSLDGRIMERSTPHPHHRRICMCVWEKMNRKKRNRVRTSIWMCHVTARAAHLCTIDYILSAWWEPAQEKSWDGWQGGRSEAGPYTDGKQPCHVHIIISEHADKLATICGLMPFRVWAATEFIAKHTHTIRLKVIFFNCANTLEIAASATIAPNIYAHTCS